MTDADPTEVAEAVLTALEARGRLGRARPVIGVGGESGSGKSTTAIALAAALVARGRPAAVLHQDDYFRLPPATNHAHRCESLAHVGPHEVDLERLAAHLAAFRTGARGVPVPRVDYPGNRFLEETVDFAPLDALVVEGTYVLGLPDLDARVFLSATWEETRERRRARARDIDAPIIDRILAIEHRLIAPYAAVADIVLDGAFRPRG